MSETVFDRVALFLARGVNRVPPRPFTVLDLAESLDLPRSSVARAVLKLMRQGYVAVVEDALKIGRAYQWCAGVRLEILDGTDGRGKHGKHLRGAKWIRTRQQRAALKKARQKLGAARAVKRIAGGARVLGVSW